MVKNCLFCRIFKGEIKAEVLYRDEEVMVFKDVNPQAPNHALVIPAKHIESINEVREGDSLLAGKMVAAASAVAASLNMKSYRLVFNCGPDAGQEVFHIHLHLLGGRKFGWPPG
ncbi:MAG: histidine triad nucleotide-binding protein [bacterium]